MHDSPQLWLKAGALNLHTSLLYVWSAQVDRKRLIVFVFAYQATLRPETRESYPVTSRGTKGIAAAVTGPVIGMIQLGAAPGNQEIQSPGLVIDKIYVTRRHHGYDV